MLLALSRQGSGQKRLIAVVFICLLLTNITSASENSDEWSAPLDICSKIPELQFNGTLANQSVVWQTELGPRLPGSNASATLRSSLAENLTADGWKVEFNNHTSHEINLTNVVATWSPQNLSQNQSENLTRIVLSAHYDTRNIADKDSNQSLRNTPILGANDGASGVAVLVELAKHIPTMNLNHEIMLLFSDAEDQGDNYTLGAKAWADNLSMQEINRTESFILLDMVGDADLQLTKISPSTPSLNDNLMVLGQKLGLSSQVDGCDGQGLDIMQSNQTLSVYDDHVHAFFLGIPSLDIIDIAYGENATPFGGYWHTTQDTADKVSAESLQHVGNIVELGLITGAWSATETPSEQLENPQNGQDSNDSSSQQEEIDEEPFRGSDSSTMMTIVSSGVLILTLLGLLLLRRFVD